MPVVCLPTTIQGLAFVRRDIDDGTVMVGKPTFGKTWMIYHKLNYLEKAVFAIDIGNTNFGFQWPQAAFIIFP